jgi:tetratricopeptide (TPR) repeat protein
MANGLDDDARALYIRRAMKTFVSSLVLLGILAVSGGSLVRAAEPPPSLQKGKVLILRNEYTMEGDIERLGDRYRVRRRVGETWVPAERVLSLVASLPDAYAYLRRRINLDDADERLRLARWCRANGLQKQALAELQAAAELRPDHAETRRLLQHWKQGIRSAAPAKPAAPPSSSDSVDLPPIEVTSESLGMFATRVQPILMNTCASCHATGRGGKFQLTQVYEDTINNRRAVERNLAAVLAEINLNQPEESRLLLKAVSDHAHIGRAPLRDRQIAPYRTLESWVKLTVANNPHLRDSLPASTTAPSLPPSPLPLPLVKERRPQAHKTSETSEWGADARSHAAPLPSPLARGEKANAAPPSSVSMPASSSVPASPPPTPPAAPPDPYDPEPFNQKMHPEANKPGPEK